MSQIPSGDGTSDVTAATSSVPTNQPGQFYPPPAGYTAVAVAQAPVTIARDIHCRRCSYNLRGLSTDGMCPECGTPIAASVSGDLLERCDPVFVATLLRGTRAILWGIVLLIFAVVASVALVFALGKEAAPLASLITLGGYAVIVAGSWFLTTPDPSGAGEDLYGTSRKIIRYTLIVGVVNTLIDSALKFTDLNPMTSSLLQVLAAVAGIIGIVGMVAQLQYYSKLARRIPDMALSARADFLKVTLPICLVLTQILGILMALTVGTAPTPSAAGPMALFGCAMSIIGIAMLVFSIMYLLMIEKFNKRFKERLAMAQRNWELVGASAVN